MGTGEAQHDAMEVAVTIDIVAEARKVDFEDRGAGA